MADQFWTFILCVSLTVVVSQDVTVYGDCTHPIRPEPMTVWGVIRDPLICRQWGTSSCSNGNLPPQVEGIFMGAPESLKAEGVLIPGPTGGTLIPQLIVTWTPPRSAAGFENLKGFNMEVHKLAGPHGAGFICRVFDFSESNFTSKDYRLTFQKKFVQFIGGPKYLYRLDLYTLPRSPASIPKRQFFTLQGQIVENDTANWSASISYDVENITAPATITVVFSLAPSSYMFPSYFIQLVTDADDKNALISCYVEVNRDYECQNQNHLKPDENATSVSHTFYDIPAGTYAVWVQAHDPYWQDDNCLCYHGYHDVDGVMKRNCDRCITTETGKFVVEGDVPIPTQPTSSKGDPPANGRPQTSTTDDQLPDPVEVKSGSGNDAVVAATVVGVVFGLFLVAVVGFFLRRQHHGSMSLPFRRIPQNNTKILPPTVLPKKTVYLLYATDHKDHVNVVTKFASFLTNRCHCQVFFIPWFRGEIQTKGCYEWVMSNINKSDYVIIINSEAAFNLYDARNTNTSFRIDDQGPEVDTFSMALTHVMTKSGQPDFYKKTILTYFEYTSEEFVLKDLNPGIQYKLPKHMKELLCHIHEVDMYTADPRQLEVIPMDNLSATNEGRELQEAITKTKHFQKSNRDWFHERFHRQDSAYDSISNPDLEDVQDVADSVSASPAVYNGMAPDFGQEENDEDKSCITYHTRYMDTHHDGKSFIPPSDIATTAPPTDYINTQLHYINVQDMGSPVYKDQFQQSPYGSPSMDEEFYPPSDVQVDGDINERFITLNMDCYDQDMSHLTHQDAGHKLTDGQLVQGFNNLSQKVEEDEEEEDELTDGRDV